MSSYRSAALALAACTASLALAACTAGITTATGPATSAPAPTRTASAAATSRPASSGRMIAITGPLGSFPVPARAKVAENIAIGRQIDIIFGSVTPAEVSSFYASALPRAGYTISGNSLISENGTEAVVQFTGHGFKGNIAALSKVPASQASFPGLGTKNVTTILLAPS